MLQNAPARLRQLMREPGLIWGPGVYDGLSARIAGRVGFPMLYMTGAGTSISRIGQPDVGLTTMSEMVENARVIVEASAVPVVCDADTGFGGPVNVARAVHAYERAGAAAVHIEDQVFPKRCGHLSGKTVVGRDEFAQRIRAAVNERYDPQFVIIARTDARQPNGFDDAMDRIKLAFDAGADVGFFEGPVAQAEVERVIAEAPGPMLLNLATNGVTPNLRVREVEALGFKFAIWPTACFAPAALAIRNSLEELKRDGTDLRSVGGLSPRDVFEIVGLEEAMAIDRRSGSSALSTA
jgi:2-methylisocitrate lyase-like PEP mutase family enzyme